MNQSKEVFLSQKFISAMYRTFNYLVALEDMEIDMLENELNDGNLSVDNNNYISSLEFMNLFKEIGIDVE